MTKTKKVDNVRNVADFCKNINASKLMLPKKLLHGMRLLINMLIQQKSSRQF